MTRIFRQAGALALISLCVLAAVCVLVVLGPFVAPDSAGGDAAVLLAPPSWQHVLGTDNYGRDLLAGVLRAGRASLTVAFVVIGASFGISLPIGAIAGYAGGALDEALMRVTDVFMAFPQLLLAILFASAVGGGMTTMVVALVATWWPWYARLVRARAAVVGTREFVLAARALGASSAQVLFRHIVPNTSTVLLMQATSDVGAALLAASALSFLGLGAQPPDRDWGQMVADGRLYFPGHWWYATVPGAVIFVTAFASAHLGDVVHMLVNRRASH